MSQCSVTDLPLLDQPFHDASFVCVPNPPRQLGDEVKVRVWVPRSYKAKSVVLRQVFDGEPRVTTCVLTGADGSGDWFEASVIAHSPLTRYRFALVGGADSPCAYAWLNAAGLVDHDVSDSRDFSLVVQEDPPAWVSDAVVYQIFPDRFARSSASAPITEAENLPEWAIAKPWDEPCSEDGYINGKELYGGDLHGIEERLDYIQSLGVNTLYLCPIFPAGSAHRYDASTFDTVDPLLGGDEALESLMTAVHSRGMRLIMDLTTNHTGDKHEWFRRAQSDPESDEAGYYFFTDYPNEYVSWLGVRSLPKLDHSNENLRRRMYEGRDSVTSHWLAEPFNVDGWRIDVANMTGRQGAQDLTLDVARAIREDMPRDRWLLAEHFHDATRDLPGDGWDGAMNYAGFTRPLWAWLTKPESNVNWLGMPMNVPLLPTQAVLDTLREYNAELTWRARIHSQNQLCSHDTARTRTVIGDAHRHAAAIGALVALPGVPCIFAGDELAFEGNNGEHSRTPMPWQAIDSGSLSESQESWRELTSKALHARQKSEALREGGLRFVHVGPDSMTFVRTHPTKPVLVHVARSAHEEIILDESALLASLSSEGALFDSGAIDVETCGPTKAGHASAVKNISRDVNAKSGHLSIRASGAGAVILPLIPLAQRASASK